MAEKKQPKKAGNQKASLRKLAAFDGLGDRELGQLYQMAEIRRLKRGEYLIHEGETDQTAYIILDGVIGVVKDMEGKAVELASLGEGDWVGEIAFTRRIRRTASALAKVPSSVMVLDQTTLDALDPQSQLFFYRTLNDLAAQRIADLSAREEELSGKNQQLVDYITSSRLKDRSDYGSSAMIRNIVTNVPRLPAFASEMALKLLGEDVAPAEVAEMVKEDPALSALVLKKVNSPFYGLSQKVADIHHAIVLLGYNELYQLVLSEGVRRTMPNTKKFQTLHFHSISMSHLAFTLAQESGALKPTSAATVALLHDIGQSVLELLKERNPKLSTLIDALDHAQLGSLLLKEWNMPDEISRAVEFQFHPEFAPPERIPDVVRPHVTVLHLAHLVHDYLAGTPEAELPRAFLNEYVAFVGWRGETVEVLTGNRLLPSLGKKLNTFPASFRKLIATRLKARKTGA